MIAMFLAAAAAFAVAILGTPVLIRALRERGIGQEIRDDGPIEHPHVAKAGTPTMGGLAIVGACVVGYLVAHLRTTEFSFATSGLTLMGLIVGAGVVGFVDDWLGIVKRRNLGLRKRGKLGGQIAIGAAFAVIALAWVDVSTNLSFTRDLDFDLGSAGWFCFAVLMIIATTNAVNLTDGLDGLAAGSGALAFSAYMIIAFWEFRHPEVYGILPAQAIDLATVAAAMAGACAGFLWWNAPPARIFMGDTGSLALGAGLSGLALLTQTDLLLVIIGGLYLLETLSVVAQVISFRFFGRRVLRMAPLHHHFEVGGWPETTVIVRFWLIAALLVVMGVGLYYWDFIHIPGAID